MPGDANGDGKVDVGDLGILAANYGSTVNITWDKGDFNNDGKVDVGDLGIFAANYGADTVGSSDYPADIDRAFGAASEKVDNAGNSVCSEWGVFLVAGFFFGFYSCLCLVKIPGPAPWRSSPTPRAVSARSGRSRRP